MAPGSAVGLAETRWPDAGHSSAQDGGEISVRYLDVIGIARRLASMLGRCNNDDRKLGVSMLDRLLDAAGLGVKSTAGAAPTLRLTTRNLVYCRKGPRKSGAYGQSGAHI